MKWTHFAWMNGVSETRLWMEAWWFQTTPCPSPCPWSWIGWSRCWKCSHLGCTDNLRQEKWHGGFHNTNRLLWILYSPFCSLYQQTGTTLNGLMLFAGVSAPLPNSLMLENTWTHTHTHIHWGRVIFIPLILPALTRRCHCSLTFPGGADTSCFLPALMIPRAPLWGSQFSQMFSLKISGIMYRLTCPVNAHQTEVSLILMALQCRPDTGIQFSPRGSFYECWGNSGHGDAHVGRALW